MVRVVPRSNWGGGRHVRDAPKQDGFASRVRKVDQGAIQPFWQGLISEEEDGITAMVKHKDDECETSKGRRDKEGLG